MLRPVWRVLIAVAVGYFVLACGRVAEDAVKPGNEGGAGSSTGGLPSSGGSAGTGGQSSSGGSAGSANPAGSGGTPALEGCFGVSPTLGSEALSRRVEAKLGLRIAPEALETSGLTMKARGLRLSEAILTTVHESGLPASMADVIRDFVVDRFLFETDRGTGERRRASFTSELPPNLGDDMDEEFELAISQWMLDENATLEGLLTCDTAFVSAALAAHYGIPLEPAQRFEAARLQADTQMGLATRGAFLGRYPRPPDRALQLAEALRCTTIPPLPLSTPSLWDDPDRKPAKQLIQMTYGDEQVTCASCHQFYVGYGIALDGYDELGRYRPTRNGYTVDTSYFVSVDPGSNVDFSSPRDLGRALSKASTVRKCLVESFVARIGLDGLSEEELGCVLSAFDERGASFSSLLAILTPRLIDAE
jgi:hypothetical protein